MTMPNGAERPTRANDDSRTAPDGARRELLKAPLALAASAVALPAVWTSAREAKAGERSDAPRLAPRYYPLRNFRPQIALSGKLAVVTGASRGIGRAVGEALAASGATVIGTSRNPASVPNPPAFPLLPLDIANPVSVSAFLAALRVHPAFAVHGQLDILVNNAGRFVIGQLIPQPPTDPAFYFAQRELAVRTLYSGHVMVTNALLPLIPRQGYARILYTVSVASYFTSATIQIGSFADAYNSSKAALRTYANNLDAVLRAAGTGIRVGTVNPYTVHTAGAEHPHPIYTQPVNASGLSDSDTAFNAVIGFLRQAVAGALPPRLAGEAYAQLLQSTHPPQNVVVASPREPFATMGLNTIIEPAIVAENGTSAVPLVCD